MATADDVKRARNFRRVLHSTAIIFVLLITALTLLVTHNPVATVRVGAFFLILYLSLVIITSVFLRVYGALDDSSQEN